MNHTLCTLYISLDLILRRLFIICMKISSISVSSGNLAMSTRFSFTVLQCDYLYQYEAVIMKPNLKSTHAFFLICYSWKSFMSRYKNPKTNENRLYILNLFWNKIQSWLSMTCFTPRELGNLEEGVVFKKVQRNSRLSKAITTYIWRCSEEFRLRYTATFRRKILLIWRCTESCMYSFMNGPWRRNPARIEGLAWKGRGQERFW